MEQNQYVNENGEELSIEDAFGRIRELLGEMEQEDAPLEKTFENYEEGIGLLRYCSEKIDLVEKKVQKLNADGTTESFE